MLPSTSGVNAVGSRDGSSTSGPPLHHQQHQYVNGGDVAAASIGARVDELIDEMRVQDFDSIRFATYRTACKLRFVQSKTNVHLVDIFNMIESFRENGLNAMPTTSHLKISRLELLLASVFHNLNKRLPTSQQVDTDRSIALLLHFLLSAYDRQRIGRITIFAIKVGLATLCAGKLLDKLKYIFSQISDSTGVLVYEQFVDYLQQVLSLPTAVFEGPTFGFSEHALAQCFRRSEQVTLNLFLDTIMSETCPPCLMWLPLLHRMASVEHVYHPVVCDACQVSSFTGFRYKCQRCTNYQLCQSCFWRGRTSGNHTNEHEMKEYSSYKSPTKQIAHSIQKSLQCVPVAHSKRHQEFSTKPQRPLDLANIMPSTPMTLRRAPPEPITDWTTHLLPGQYGNASAMDDEHRLIARYAAKLAGRTAYPPQQMLSVGGKLARASMLDERALIARLEEENAEMLREMALLEQQQMDMYGGDSTGQLNGLRERTTELEAKMREKQQQRRELMLQLEQLMAQLNASPTTQQRIPSASLAQLPHGSISSAISAAFREGSAYSPRARAVSVPTTASQLQGDLLQAADEITSNMTDLVRELEGDADQSNDEEMGPGPSTNEYHHLNGH